MNHFVSHCAVESRINSTMCDTGKRLKNDETPVWTIFEDKNEKCIHRN